MKVKTLLDLIVKFNQQNKKHNKQSSTCSNGNLYSSKLCCLLQKVNRGRNPIIFAFNGQHFPSLKYLLQQRFVCIRLMERVCVVIKTLTHIAGVYFENYKCETPPSGSGKLACTTLSDVWARMMWLNEAMENINYKQVMYH